MSHMRVLTVFGLGAIALGTACANPRTTIDAATVARDGGADALSCLDDCTGKGQVCSLGPCTSTACTASEDVATEDRGERHERVRSDGAYGIWGHPLEHLVLRSARWVKQSNGDVRIDLHVDAKPLPPPPATPELVSG